MPVVADEGEDGEERVRRSVPIPFRPRPGEMERG
jgi:hypothetical protein